MDDVMISVAIDGPAGAGKSTIARAVAKALGFLYVDTGALYRSIAFYALAQGIDPSDESLVLPLLKEIKVELAFQNGEQRVILCQKDVTDSIRTSEVSMAASKISAIPAVRQFLFGLQRDMAERYNVIMDGRDIGTVVLPNAKVKIFLTASAEDRAKRRYDEMISKGESAVYEQVLQDIRRRDEQDANRAIAPLRPAPDAILLDTTGNRLEDSIALLRSTIEEHLK